MRELTNVQPTTLSPKKWKHLYLVRNYVWDVSHPLCFLDQYSLYVGCPILKVSANTLSFARVVLVVGEQESLAATSHLVAVGRNKLFCPSVAFCVYLLFYSLTPLHWFLSPYCRLNSWGSSHNLSPRDSDHHCHQGSKPHSGMCG